MTLRSMGKFLYAVLFLVVFPVVLWYWGELTTDLVTWPGVHSPFAGSLFLLLGMLLMLWGMWALYVYGKGLPMNAFPPKNLVMKGPYRLFNHPIYVGFAFVLIGYSLFSGVSSLLWLVTPITILGMIALVLGFERIDLKDRFKGYSSDALFSIPKNNHAKPSITKRIAMVILIIFSTICASLIIGILLPVNNVESVMPWFPDLSRYDTIVVIAVVFAITIPPLLTAKASALRHWTLSSLISILLVLYLTLLLPESGGFSFMFKSKSQIPQSELSANNWHLISAVFELPMLLIAYSLSRRRFQNSGILVTMSYSLVILGFLFITQFNLMSLLYSLIVFFISYYWLNIWKAILRWSENIANSWHEIIIGPFRIINHGIYVGAGAFLGTLLIGWLAGSQNMWGIVLFAFVVTICSALWAQVIEGSDKLKRPFGFYGALLGILFAGGLVWFLGYDVWVIIGATSVAMPWIQAIGRLRCLINGCCHGSKIENHALGIKYHHFRSRVVNISNLKDVSLHPTPVYSIVWLFFCGFVLLSIWIELKSVPLVFGLYLILNGLGRFVEEAYRGEVQTPSANKLRLYQWTAIVSVIVGILMTSIPIQSIEVITQFDWQIPVGSFLIGIFIFFAMGVDFPKSNARFSRLV